MKKTIFLSMVLFGLLACENRQVNEPENVEPLRPITLHATVVNPGEADGVAKVAPVDPTAATVTFVWEPGDQVIVKNSTGVFTLTAANINGNKADLEGNVAGDMSEYSVYYGFDPTVAAQIAPYRENSFRPCITGMGSGYEFMLDEFLPVIKLQLKGNVTLGKIEYLADGELKTTMPFPDGLALNESAATIVYLPTACVSTHGFTLRFYDNAAAPNLLLTKETTYNLHDKMGKVVTFPELLIPAPVYDYVDLGLSVKWATRNIGASSPEDAGYYFAWGEISPKPNYTVDNYKWYNGIIPNPNVNPLARRYITKYSYIYWGMNEAYEGNNDNIKTLEPIDDAAIQNWGEHWRIPTESEVQELLNNCELVGVGDFYDPLPRKIIVTSKVPGYTDKSIILPLAGFQDADDPGNIGSQGYYWTNSLNSYGTLQSPHNGGYLFLWIGFYNNFLSHKLDGYPRYRGMSIRPVYVE